MRLPSLCIYQRMAVALGLVFILILGVLFGVFIDATSFDQTS